MSLLCPFLHCKALRTAMYKRYLNFIVIIIIKRCFHVNKHNIEIVNNYTHLGINFSSNENFKVCKSNLKDKVRRSFFATGRYLDFSKIPSDTTNKLFNSLFQPILLRMVQRYGVFMTKMTSPTGKKILLKKHNLPL